MINTKKPSGKVGTGHIANARRQKLYYLASLVAYQGVEVNPTTNWPRTFKTQAKKLGNVGGMTLENTMGFPDD